MNNGVRLGDAYDATLERIRAQDGEKAKLAMATLMWVCHSERPLQPIELCNALAVEIGSADFDPNNVPPIATLLGCCQGLITVDKEASTVRLIHYTLQEYLSAYPDLFTTAHSTIAETCLAYLNSPWVRKLSLCPIPDYKSMLFLKYSSRHWGAHAKRQFSDCAMSLALELLNQYENHISAIILLYQFWSNCITHNDSNNRSNDDSDDDSNDDSNNYSNDDSSRDFGGTSVSSLFSGLHCASFFGLVELATMLIDKKVGEINQEDCTGLTPLSWAAENGHEEVVRLLLEQENIDHDCRDTEGTTPLQLAARNGHEDVVKLLLNKGNVNINKDRKSVV